MRGGIDPADVNVIAQAVGNLVVDLVGESRQAAKGRLDVSARAAESVVEIEVTEGGVEIVDPDELHHAAAEPDAFRVAGGTVDRALGFDELVDLVLAFLGGLGLAGGGFFALLFLGLLVAALG